MKVLWLTNIPSPYRVEFFNELGKYCELSVLFERGYASDRDLSWENFSFRNFKGIILKGIHVGADYALAPQVIGYLERERYDIVVSTTLSTPTGMMAIRYMQRKGIPYLYESDGGFAKSGKGIKESLKTRLLKGAELYFSTSNVHDDYYLTYGAKKEKIVRFPFSSLRESDILTEPIDLEERNMIREQLKIYEEKVILSVGQFIHRKGFDVLIKAFSKVDPSAGLYIVGGEPTSEYLTLKQNLNLSNVHFVGFKLKDELADYFKAANIFALPTREDIWGLVINEAMAYGLPVITTDKCIAGLELIKNGKNGFIVPVDDETSLTEKIKIILENADLQKKMAESNLQKIRFYTIENMAKVHLDFFKEFLMRI